MPRSADRALGLGALILGLAFLVAMTPTRRAPAYPDQAVPAHTGGFGEPTCLACHFDGDLNPPGGELTVVGWPEKLEPGADYELAVRIAREEMGRAGFQLAVRTAEGAQAGTLAPADERSAVVESGGVEYLHHTLDGTELTDEAEATWRFTWTAPDTLAPLRVHIVANAANDDASEFGDAIYADSLAFVP